VTVSGIYMLMGTALEPMHAAHAGSIVALDGVSSAILKSATLSSTLHCPPVAPMTFQSSPLVRVAVEPKDPTKLPELVAGLRLLNRADPFVETSFQDSGEHILGAAGEVHLETCIKDLQERFAKIELEVSAPLVSFRESVAMVGDDGGDDWIGGSEKSEHINEAGNAGGGGPQPQFAWGEVFTVRLPSGMATARVRVAPMHLSLARAIEHFQGELMTSLSGHNTNTNTGTVADAGRGRTASTDGSLGERIAKKASTFAAARFGEEYDSHTVGSAEDALAATRDAAVVATRMTSVLSSACSLGPKQTGANILVVDDIAIGDDHGADAPLRVVRARPSVACALGLTDGTGPSPPPPSAPGGADEEPKADGDDMLTASVESSIVTGFQLASAAGPLCEEPLFGVLFSADVIIHAEDDAIVASEEQHGPFAGQLIAAVREACRGALNSTSPRLVEALYLCEATTTAETLGSTYAVLGRRRAQVLREEMLESGLFSVHALLPIASSFKFADELRRSTSGAASAQLVMSHWQRLETDPFFVPTTFEEREEHGEGGETGPNIAKQLIDAVRRRRGLYVKERVVEKATKQRTLARKV